MVRRFESATLRLFPSHLDRTGQTRIVGAMNPKETGWRALYFVWRKGAPRPEPMRFPPNPDGRGVVLDLGGGIRIIQDGPPVGKLKHHKDGAYGLLP